MLSLLVFYLLWILPYLIVLGIVVHGIKTGQNFVWMWLAVLSLYRDVFTYLLGLTYFFMVLLPELRQGRWVRRTLGSFKKAMNPAGELQRLGHEARLTTNVDTRQRYADELAAHGRYDEAIEQYRSVLTGLYAHDPKLMLGIARAQFGKGDAAAARATLDDLERQNPDFRSPDCQLLYARALEAAGEIDRALERYAALAGSYPGAEAAVRYAQLLSAQGRRAEAQRVAREILDQARIAPDHYRKAQRSWLASAERLATSG